MRARKHEAFAPSMQLQMMAWEKPGNASSFTHPELHHGRKLHGARQKVANRSLHKAAMFDPKCSSWTWSSLDALTMCQKHLENLGLRKPFLWVPRLPFQQIH